MNIYNNIIIIILIITIILNYFQVININKKIILLIIIINRLLKKNLYENFTDVSADEYKEVIPDDIVPELGCTKEYPYLSSHDGQTYCYNNRKCTDAEERINDYCGPNTRVVGSATDPPDEGCTKQYPYRTKHPDDSSDDFKYCYTNKKCTTPEGRPEEDCGATTRASPPDVYKASDQWIAWYNMSKEDQEATKKACDDIDNTVFNLGVCTQLSEKEICEQEGGTYISGLKTGGKSICERPEEIQERVIECCECVNTMDDKKLFRLFGQFLNGDSATIPNEFAKPLTIKRKLMVNGNIYVKGKVRLVNEANNKLYFRNGSVINANNKELLQIGSSGTHHLNVSNNFLYGDNTMSIKETFKNNNTDEKKRKEAFKNIKKKLEFKEKKETFKNNNTDKKERKEHFFNLMQTMANHFAKIQEMHEQAMETARVTAEAEQARLAELEKIVNVDNPGFELHDLGQLTGKVGSIGYKLDHKIENSKDGLNSRQGPLTVEKRMYATGQFTARSFTHNGTPGQCYIHATESRKYMDCGYDGQWRHQTGEWFSHIS